MRELRPRGVELLAKVYTASKPVSDSAPVLASSAGTARGHQTYYLKTLSLTALKHTHYHMQNR